MKTYSYLSKPWTRISRDIFVENIFFFELKVVKEVDVVVAQAKESGAKAT